MNQLPILENVIRRAFEGENHANLTELLSEASILEESSSSDDTEGMKTGQIKTTVVMENQEEPGRMALSETSKAQELPITGDTSDSKKPKTKINKNITQSESTGNNEFTKPLLTVPKHVIVECNGSVIAKVKFINPLDDINYYLPDDLGCGRLFADTFKEILRYVSDAKIWRFFNIIKWDNDNSETVVYQCARALVDSLMNVVHPEMKDYLKKLRKRSGRKIMIEEAKSINPLRSSDFDRNTKLVNCQNFTIDLTNMTHYKHKPDDYITKAFNVAYKPEAECPRWLRFIDEIMRKDKELAKFLQTIFGYIITGDTEKECFFVFYGKKTRNGKGTLLEAVLNILFDYGKALSPASLAQKSTSSNNPAPEFARLAGVRMASVGEPEKGQKLNVALCKRLTGGDPIIARNLFENPIEYRPQFKIIIATNHLLLINDITIFSSGRVMLVPFEQHFEDSNDANKLKESLKRDDTLKSLFKQPDNASAIFNWILEGYKHYREEGLIPPSKSVEALNDYRRECDTISLFINDALVKCHGERPKTGVVYAHYLQWCVNREMEAKSQKDFVAELRDKGLVARIGKDGNTVSHYKIKADNVSV
jgi:putative DNA primase/helicase